jgi:hypothetical protein
MVLPKAVFTQKAHFTDNASQYRKSTNDIQHLKNNHDANVK